MEQNLNIFGNVMMTKEELNTLITLNEKFLANAERVASILDKVKDFHDECSDIHYADTFRLEDNSVWWEGDESWYYGGHEHHSGEFDVELLSMTDEELNSMVDKLNKEYDERELKKQKEKEEAEKKKEFEQYMKLKEKFGN